MSKINEETGHYAFCFYDPHKKGTFYCCKCHGKSASPISCYNMLCGDCWYSFCIAHHWDRHLSSCANYRCDELNIKLSNRSTINQYNFRERLDLVCYTRYVHVSSVRRSIAVEKHKMKKSRKVGPKLKKIVNNPTVAPELFQRLFPEAVPESEPEVKPEIKPKIVPKVKSELFGQLYDWTGVPIPEPEGWTPLPDPEIEELTNVSNPDEKLPDISDIWVKYAFPSL